MNLIESIYKEPEKWSANDQFVFQHENGANLWIANGVFFCQPHPGGNFGIIDKWKAWRAYRWWCRTAPIEKYATNKS